MLGQIHKRLDGLPGVSAEQLRPFWDEGSNGRYILEALVLDIVNKNTHKRGLPPKHLYEHLDTLETEVLEDSPQPFDSANMRGLPPLQMRGKPLGMSVGPPACDQDGDLGVPYNSIRDLQVAKSQQVGV